MHNCISFYYNFRVFAIFIICKCNFCIFIIIFVSFDQQGNTPLYLSVCKGHTKAVDLLLKNEAAVNTHSKVNMH